LRPSKRSAVPFRSIFDLEAKQKELLTLQKTSESPDFWNAPDAAQQVMKRISDLTGVVEEWQAFNAEIQDLKALIEMDDGSLTEEITAQISALEETLAKKETELLLSGKYDHGNALLAVHSGAGGTDSQDWAAMLEIMYLRWA
jgi:peptide chain release factor 2